MTTFHKYLSLHLSVWSSDYFSHLEWYTTTEINGTSKEPKQLQKVKLRLKLDLFTHFVFVFSVSMHLAICLCFLWNLTYTAKYVVHHTHIQFMAGTEVVFIWNTTRKNKSFWAVNIPSPILVTISDLTFTSSPHHEGVPSDDTHLWKREGLLAQVDGIYLVSSLTIEIVTCER